MNYWKQSNKKNAQSDSEIHGENNPVQGNTFGPSQDVMDRYNELLRRYNKAADDFKDIISTAKDVCESDPEEMKHLEGIVGKYNTTNTLIQGYGDKIQKITDTMEQTVLMKSFENSISALESYYSDVQKLISGHRSVKKSEGFSLFAGCDTVEKLKRRYKELSKNYHPDTLSGDKDAMQEINIEYERLLKAFEIQSV